MARKSELSTGERYWEIRTIARKWERCTVARRWDRCSVGQEGGSLVQSLVNENILQFLECVNVGHASAFHGSTAVSFALCVC